MSGIEEIRDLSEAFGVSGYESPVSSLIISRLPQNRTKTYTDAIGNVVCRCKGRDSTHKVMVIAHLDEVGFQVLDVDTGGVGRVRTLGNIKRISAENRLLQTADNRIAILVADDTTSTPASSEIESLLLRPVVGEFRIGDVLTFASPFVDGEHTIVGKALDNRLSCYCLLETLRMRQEWRYDTYFVFSVQEETGMRGARVAVSSIDPDVIVDVDVSCVGERNSLKIDEGVGVKISDSVGVSDQQLVSTFERIAQQTRIQYQREVSDCGTTELIITNERDSGARHIGLSIPCRKIHGALSMACKRDIENCHQLLAAVLSSMRL